MNELIGKIQCILFVATKPLAIKKIAELAGAETEKVEQAITQMKSEMNSAEAGIQILEADGKFQFITNPKFADVVESLVKDEVSGELTRPQMETLAIIAYRGPIAKYEIEQIRGINCSLILRNLLMRGLIEEREDASSLLGVYVASPDLVRHLGVRSIDELPDYGTIHSDEQITDFLKNIGVEKKDDDNANV